jgi:hypothetical protein
MKPTRFCHLQGMLGRLAWTRRKILIWLEREGLMGSEEKAGRREQAPQFQWL